MKKAGTDLLPGDHVTGMTFSSMGTAYQSRNYFIISGYDGGRRDTIYTVIEEDGMVETRYLSHDDIVEVL